MEIRQSTATPFLDKVFDVKMTGAELAVVFAIIGQTTGENVKEAIRQSGLAMEEELIVREHDDSISYEAYGDILVLLRKEEQKTEGY